VVSLHAADFSVEQNGNWDDADTWGGLDTPGVTDNATVGLGKSLSIDNGVANLWGSTTATSTERTILTLDGGNFSVTNGSLTGNYAIRVGAGSNAGSVLTVGGGTEAALLNLLPGGDYRYFIGVGGYSGTNAGGTINLHDNGTINSTHIHVGSMGTGTFNMDGGALNLATSLTMGFWDNGNGTFNMSGGTANAYYLYVGYSPRAVGTANITGGSFTAQTILIGANAGANGTLILDGGSLTTRASSYVGNGIGSQGTLTIKSGTLQNGGTLRVGFNGGNGTLNMNGGTLNSTSYISIGYDNDPASVNNTFNMTGGTINITGGANVNFVIGMGNGSGNGTMSGGTFNIDNYFRVSTTRTTNGTFTMTGGTVNAGLGGNQIPLTHSGSHIFQIGADGGAGCVTLSGSAAFNVYGNAVLSTSRNILDNGSTREAILTINGGSFNVINKTIGSNTTLGRLVVGFDHNSNATLNISGGELNIDGYFRVGDGNSSNFYENNAGSSLAKGTLNVSGTAKITAKDTTIIGGYTGTGFLNMTGGSFNGTTFYVGYNSQGSAWQAQKGYSAGTVDMSGGSMKFSSVAYIGGHGANATVNFSKTAYAEFSAVNIGYIAGSQVHAISPDARGVASVTLSDTATLNTTSFNTTSSYITIGSTGYNATAPSQSNRDSSLTLTDHASINSGNNVQVGDYRFKDSTATLTLLGNSSLDIKGQGRLIIAGTGTGAGEASMIVRANFRDDSVTTLIGDLYLAGTSITTIGEHASITVADTGGLFLQGNAQLWFEIGSEDFSGHLTLADGSKTGTASLANTKIVIDISQLAISLAAQSGPEQQFSCNLIETLDGLNPNSTSAYNISFWDGSSFHNDASTVDTTAFNISDLSYDWDGQNLELQFTYGGQIPEPATTALLLGAFALSALALRRRTLR
jgi:hypothetical protein